MFAPTASRKLISSGTVTLRRPRSTSDTVTRRHGCPRLCILSATCSCSRPLLRRLSERAVLAAAQAKVAAEGLPLHVAMRTCGRTRSEAVAYYSALGDVQDAREKAQRARMVRQLAANAGLIDVPQPPDREVEVAPRMMRSGEDLVSVGRGVRARGLRRQYRAWNDRA